RGFASPRRISSPAAKPGFALALASGFFCGARVGPFFYEVDGVSDGLQSREAFAELGMVVEEIPEVLQRGLDVAVGAVEQRVDAPAHVVANLWRCVRHGKARCSALFEPLRCLTVRLAAPPGVEEGRHSGSIGRHPQAMYPSRVYPVFGGTAAARRGIHPPPGADPAGR